MKKSVKILLLTVVSIVVIFAVAGALFLFKMNKEVSTMSPLETGEYNNGIFAVKDSFVNMYLVKGDDRYIAFDAGDKTENIESGMEVLKIDPLKVAAVFLTHSDSDHVAALGLFQNAAVYISKNEERMINGEKARFAVFHNKINTAYTTLKDGQEVIVPGLIVSCISTPGHTPGAMSYVVNGKYIFTGDSLSLKDGKVGLFNEFFNMDSEKQKETLKKLAHLKGITHIYTGHHGMSDDFEKAFEGWK